MISNNVDDILMFHHILQNFHRMRSTIDHITEDIEFILIL